MSVGSLSLEIGVGGRRRSQLPSSMVGAAAVIGTFVGMSHRGADSGYLCFLCCHGVKSDTRGAGDGIENVNLVESLLLLTGFVSKVTMVMMTLSAFLCS